MDAKKAMETVKSQAVFAAHTAANSVKKREPWVRPANGTAVLPPASQTPMRGSPRGKQKERDEYLRSGKSKSHQMKVKGC